jgi:hypothetical protein
MRFGERPPQVQKDVTREPSSLPDETKWVAYVRQFCTRYSLTEAQQATAFAILKDLQEQAQNYRGSRSEYIEQLEAQARKAESAEERRAVQDELREVLRGIDELFEELKHRLENVPTGDQLRGG